MAPRILFTMMAALALLLVGVSTSTADLLSKVAICHFQEDLGTWRAISVGEYASTAHIVQHDDASPGGVTSKTGTQLDANCQPEVTACGTCLTTGHDGCDNPACEAAVCASDSPCCSGWDALCVLEAQSLCVEVGLCTVEATCDCSTAGCGSSTCEAAVCAADSFCCAQWDAGCEAEALTICVASGQCGGS
jgi:hypothetical protein